MPKRDQFILRHVGFLSLGDHRILVILVLDDHEVQNRVIYTNEPYSDAQLREAANFLNHKFSGQVLFHIRDYLVSSMKLDRDYMNRLMEITLALAEKAFVQKQESDYVLAGRENLISEDVPLVILDIRELLQAFAIKADILDRLDCCMDYPGFSCPLALNPDTSPSTTSVLLQRPIVLQGIRSVFLASSDRQEWLMIERFRSSKQPHVS